MCQGHESRPRSPDVTVAATILLAAKYNEPVYQRCSGSGNIAKFREVPEIRGEFACLYLENGKSYEKRP